MAEYWTKQLYSPNIQSFSAGTAPTPGSPGSVNPYAVKALKQVEVKQS
jgi:hypothetical protein